MDHFIISLDDLNKNLIAAHEDFADEENGSSNAFALHVGTNKIGNQSIQL